MLLVAIVAAASFFWPELKEHLPELEEIVGTAPTREAGGSKSASAGLLTCHVTSVFAGDDPIHCAEGPKIRLSTIAAREMDGNCRPGHPCPAATAGEE